MLIWGKGAACRAAKMSLSRKRGKASVPSVSHPEHTGCTTKSAPFSLTPVSHPKVRSTNIFILGTCCHNKEESLGSAQLSPFTLFCNDDMTKKDTLMGCYSTTSWLRWGWDGVGVGIGVGVEDTGGDGRASNKMLYDFEEVTEHHLVSTPRSRFHACPPLGDGFFQALPPCNST